MMLRDIQEISEQLVELEQSYRLHSRLAKDHSDRAMKARFYYINGEVYSVASVRYNSNMAAEASAKARYAASVIIELTRPPKHWEVHVAEYAGDGYWFDYPPHVFDTELEAIQFADVLNMNNQLSQTNMKVRGVYALFNS